MSKKASNKRKQKPRAGRTVARRKEARAAARVETSASPPMLDRRVMEGGMFRMFGGDGGGLTDDPDELAQQLMYEAFEQRELSKRIALARKALEISPNCADAYCLLAEEDASTLAEAIELLRRGVAAGEQRLGARAFEDDVGHFWGLLETRPYMRARARLAQCLWQAGEHGEALEHYRELLRLNPNDNQGNRESLLCHLIELGHDEEARELWRRYEGDFMAMWAYSAALLAFRREGDSEASREALAAAVERNPHVPAFLLGERRVPAKLPAYMSPGDATEACAYVIEAREGWKRTSGATSWLRSHVKSVRTGARKRV